jgi:hypothetical protein
MKTYAPDEGPIARLAFALIRYSWLFAGRR